MPLLLLPSLETPNIVMAELEQKKQQCMGWVEYFYLAGHQEKWLE